MQILADFDIELNRNFKEEIDSYIFNNLNFDFRSNKYPEFMKSHYENKNQYLQYTPELHVSSRIVKREFMELINLLKDEKYDKKQEIIKNINFIEKKQKNIEDFV